MIDLTNKIVLITGGSRGIGASIAETLRQAGASVILHYNQGHTEAKSIAARLGTEHCHLVQANLATPNAATALWQEALAWKGQIDVLVNNAATMPTAGIDAPLEVWNQAWQSTLQTNLIAVADLGREAILHFQTRSSGGIIINIASRAAFRGDSPDFIHYAASKGGVVALTRSIARGFAHQNILAYTVAPGFVQTERIEAVMQERGTDYVTKDIPMGAPVPPVEVARVVAFLASGLATHATGSTIDINGASYVR